MNTLNNEQLYKRYKKLKMRWFFVPLIILILTIVVWGLAAFIGDPSSQILIIMNILVPILMGLEILLILVGLAVGIYYLVKQKEIREMLKS